VQNAGETTLPYRPQHWRLQDSQEHEYPATERFGSEQMLSAHDLPPGTRVRGWVVFELPTSVQGEQLVYQPGGPATRLTTPLP
jgi:hypothetical protein